MMIASMTPSARCVVDVGSDPSGTTAAVPVHVFSRTPDAGRVKTRLIPAIGADAAQRLHRRLTRRAVEVACGAAVGPVTLWATPTSRHPFFDELRCAFDISVCDQVGAGLGERMHHAASAATASNACCIIIGSDCPFLEANDIRLAAARIRLGVDVVLGPACDGGYYLIAARRMSPRLFADVRWGSNRVLATTRARLVALGWIWSELPVRSDIDRPQDLALLGADWIS